MEGTRTNQKAPTSSSAVFFAGSASALLSTTLLQPLDVVKTRMQLSPIPTHNTPVYSQTHLKSPTRSFVGTLTYIARNDGVNALWRGTTTSCFRAVPGVGVYLTLLSHSKAYILQTDIQTARRTKMSPLQNLLAGSTSRASVAFIFMPVLVIKTRIESGLFLTYSPTNMIVTMARVVKSEGVRSLWKGTIVTILRDAPFSGLYYLFYEQTKHWLETFVPTKPSITSEVTRPDESSNIHLTLDANKNVPTHHHTSASTPTPTSIVTSPSISVKKTLVSLLQSDTIIRLGAGSVGGILATAVSHPPDIVRTRIQVSKVKKVKTMKVISQLIKDEGVRGLFIGLWPRMVRRTLSAALSWTVFEQLVDFWESRSP
eukprot:CFRG7583T1